MFNNKRIIKLAIFYIIVLTVLCYMIEPAGIFELDQNVRLILINGNKKGFNAIHDMNIHYIILVIFGFNYLYKEKLYTVTKFNSTIDYLKRVILKIIIINISVFTLVHFIITIIQNCIYLDLEYIIENKLYAILPMNSILFFLFFLIVMFQYIILRKYFSKYIAAVINISINILFYFLTVNGIVEILPQSYTSKIFECVQAGNLNIIYISLFGLACYIVIFYHILKSVYETKEYV